MAKSLHTTTIKDIAEACGVSRWSVSAVLFPTDKNRHVGASEETREKVLATARRLHYRPHRSSRNLKSQSHQVIGILSKSFYTIPGSTMQGMLDAAKRHGQLISIDSYTSGGADAQLPVFLREQVVDGLIFFEIPDPQIARALARHGIPAVYVNTSQRRLPNAINMDEAGAMEQAIALFARRAYRAVTLIVRSSVAPYELERRQALASACKRHRLPAARVLLVDERAGAPMAPYQALSEHLASYPCDAIIAPHDGLVGMIYRFCRGNERRIPHDLAVICMQNPDRLLHLEPAVSAFELPELDLGRVAVDNLNGLIAGGRPQREQRLTYHFHARGST